MSNSATSIDTVPHESNAPRVVKHGIARLRLGFLLCVLAAMFVALWYDYRIARPNVEAAYDRIAVLNNSMNSAAAFQLTRISHVQKELGRPPSRVIKNGIYTIEVYEWPAGMPLKINVSSSDEPLFGLRTHSYFAVYNGRALQRHYKFVVPPEEWARKTDASVAQLLEMLAASSRAASREADGANGVETDGKSSGRPQRPPFEEEARLTFVEQDHSSEAEANNSAPENPSPQNENLDQ